MNTWKSAVVVLFAGLSGAFAQVIYSPDGTGYGATVSSSYPDPDFVGSHLFDGLGRSGTGISVLDINQSAGTANGSTTQYYGKSWAENSSNSFPSPADPGVVVVTLDEAITISGMLYAQRTYGGADDLDNWAYVDMWFYTTDPGTATSPEVAAIIAGGSPDEHVTLVASGVGNSPTINPNATLREYEFGGDYTAQYVIMSFSSTFPNGETGPPFNPNINAASTAFPGGQELRFTTVPEPGSALLLGIGLAGTLFVTFRKRSRSLAE